MPPVHLDHEHIEAGELAMRQAPFHEWEGKRPSCAGEVERRHSRGHPRPYHRAGRAEARRDEAEGELDGKRFIRVVLRPRVTFDNEIDAGRVESLHHRAHERCFIANSVSCPVEVEAQL